VKVERYKYSTPGPRCGKWSLLVAQADPGGDPSRVHGPRGIWFQRPRTAVGYCDDTVTKVQSLQGYSAAPSGCLCAPPNDFSIRTPHLASFSPHQFWIKSPHQMQIEKFGRGIKSPHQNWKIGRGIPSPRFGVGIGNAPPQKNFFGRVSRPPL